TVERFVAEWEVGDDVVFDGCLEQWPLKPGGVAKMATIDPAAIEPKPDHDVAPEALDQRHALARSCFDTNRHAQRAAGEPVQNLIGQGKTLLYFANPDPDAGVHVTLVEHGHLEAQIVIGGITRRPAGIERAPGCA